MFKYFHCQKSVIFYTKPRLVIIIWPSLHPVDSNKNTMNYNNFPSNGIYKLNNKTSVQDGGSQQVPISVQVCVQ